MTESILHSQVAEYLNLLQSQGKLWWLHPANEGKRSVVTGARLKRHGLKPGAPDILIWLPGDHSAAIELKTPKGRVSPPQALCMDQMRAFTPNIFICRSFEECKQTIDNLIRAFPKRVERAA